MTIARILIIAILRITAVERLLPSVRNLRSPIRRFASRSSLLERTLDAMLFRGARLSDLSDKAPELVVTATELRTGSAFRFSRRESGCWRLGSLLDNNVSLAHAVAASAAYPLFLPAFDEDRWFVQSGLRVRQRLNLSDGGVYDNLGLSNFWPNRVPGISLNVNKIDTIICCSAGYGLRQEPPSQFFFSRMASAFNVTFDRAQNASIARLFDLKDAGKIKEFILPYLGQRDRELINPPADLVPREKAHSYPTDFNAMSQEWIDLLSKRGEQLTDLAVAQRFNGGSQP